MCKNAEEADFTEASTVTVQAELETARAFKPKIEYFHAMWKNGRGIAYYSAKDFLVNLSMSLGEKHVSQTLTVRLSDEPNWQGYEL